jgi:hypothetical protein
MDGLRQISPRSLRSFDLLPFGYLLHSAVLRLSRSEIASFYGDLATVPFPSNYLESTIVTPSFVDETCVISTQGVNHVSA